MHRSYSTSVTFAYIQSKESSYRGEWKEARCYGRLAFGLNTAVLVSTVLLIVFIIIIVETS